MKKVGGEKSGESLLYALGQTFLNKIQLLNPACRLFMILFNGLGSEKGFTISPFYAGIQLELIIPPVKQTSSF